MLYIKKYDAEIDSNAIINNIDRMTNQIFKLLPSREEGGEWIPALQNLTLEIVGLNIILSDQTILFSLLCKMEALQTLIKEEDFFQFRKMIFECLSDCNELKKCVA